MTKRMRTPFAAIIIAVLFALNIFMCSNICNQLFNIRSETNIITIMSWSANLFLCVVLFTKNRRNLLVFALACISLLDFVCIIRSFEIYYLLCFLADALLLLFALATSDQNIIKADFSKMKVFAKKFFYFPAILFGFIPLVTYTINIFVSKTNSLFYLLITIDTLLYFIQLLAIGAWLKDPYAKDISTVDANEAHEIGKAYCGLGKHIVLLLFTFGIWQLVWIYRTTKFLNKAPNTHYFNPTSKLLLFLLIPFYSIHWFYVHGKRIDAFSKNMNLYNNDVATLCLILGIFIPFVACIIMQDKINALCTAPSPQSKKSVADEIIKYKELLDSGVITQEEFDAKKKQLLYL